MNEEIIAHAKAISEWLRENKNPHTAVEITVSGVKVTSDDEYVPFIEAIEVHLVRRNGKLT